QKGGQLHASMVVALIAQSEGAVCPTEIPSKAIVVRTTKCRIIVFLHFRSFSLLWTPFTGPGLRTPRTIHSGASSRTHRLDLISMPKRAGCRTPADQSDWDFQSSDKAGP